jgi:hypothetical protein
MATTLLYLGLAAITAGATCAQCRARHYSLHALLDVCLRWLHEKNQRRRLAPSYHVIDLPARARRAASYARVAATMSSMAMPIAL